jgi:cysteinyl-tRNA synthetase, unknown class
MPRWMLRLYGWARAVDPALKRRVTWIGIATGLALFAWSWRDLPGNWYEATQTDRRPFSKVKSWHYQLAKVDIDTIAQIDADVVVVDYAISGVPLTAEQVAKLKVRPGKAPRVVLSYLSVGEGEEKRFYWKPEWTTTPELRPSWLNMPNCAWPGAWAVRYWQDGWKQIVYRSETSYLRRIIAAGFDGVYLDRVDMYGDYPEIAKEPVSADHEMIALVADLATTARAIKPGFIVVPNNGLDLLADRAFRRTIDGVGMEELLYSHAGTGVRNKQADINASLALLRKLQWDYKPALTLEYLITKDQIEAAKRELERLQVIGGFPTRALDGGDPTQPAELTKDPGTPEFVAKNCTKANSW